MTAVAPPTAASAPSAGPAPSGLHDLDPNTPAPHCPACGATYSQLDGIWRYLTPDGAARIAAFAHTYATVRDAEGWHHDDPAYFQALPYTHPDDPHAAIWQQRSRSFDLLLDRVVEPLEHASDRPLAILDLGAGNCWLAHRLAQRGHHVAAIDLLTNDWDGLGAHRYYPTDRIIPVQATFDRLPFADATADLAIFNASLHYAADYTATLAETLRVLRPGGQLAILDSPYYRDPASGAQMVREREAAFQQRHGFPSDTLGGTGYLTPAMLDTLAARLNIHWANLDVTPSWRQSLRRWRSQLRLGREAATMPLIVGTAQGNTLAAEITTGSTHSLGPNPSPRRRTSWPQPLARTSVPVPRRIPVPRALIRRLVRLRYLLFQRHRYDNLVLERVHGTPILVLPQVFNPKLLRTGAFLVGALNDRLIPPGSTVLDMGTGSGVGAIFAARRAARVVAVDINPAAVRCARINALMHHLEDRIDVREGNLFAPVTGERFDAILFNPPFFRGAARDPLDHAWRSEDTVERFAAALRDHLTPQGHALVVLSTDGETPAFLRAFAAHGFASQVVSARDYGNEIITVYKMSEARDQRSEELPH
ncbi:MAG: class I SAM-dependent methyltransferase [Chloroflexia bacterium]